jgi:hypothetical protein
MKSVALALHEEPSFHMMYFLSLTQVRAVAAVTVPVIVPPFVAAVLITAVPIVAPVQDRKT